MVESFAAFQAEGLPPSFYQFPSVSCKYLHLFFLTFLKWYTSILCFVFLIARGQKLFEAFIPTAVDVHKVQAFFFCTQIPMVLLSHGPFLSGQW